jgi:hypothetical protein
MVIAMPVAVASRFDDRMCRITNSPIADLIIVWAKLKDGTDKPQIRGFIVSVVSSDIVNVIAVFRWNEIALACRHQRSAVRKPHIAYTLTHAVTQANSRCVRR